MEQKVRKMQIDTESLENVFKELQLLNNEFNVIKKNEELNNFVDEEEDVGGQGFEIKNMKNECDILSQGSQDLEMVMDLPDGYDFGFEEEQGGDNNYT